MFFKAVPVETVADTGMLNLPINKLQSLLMQRKNSPTHLKLGYFLQLLVYDISVNLFFGLFFNCIKAPKISNTT